MRNPFRWGFCNANDVFRPERNLDALGEIDVRARQERMRLVIEDADVAMPNSFSDDDRHTLDRSLNAILAIAFEFE